MNPQIMEPLMKVDELTMNLKFDNEECSICYSAPQKNKASLLCGHVFCRSCLLAWSKKNNICPFCIQKFQQFLYVNDDGNTEIQLVSEAEAELEQDPENNSFFIEFKEAFFDSLFVLYAHLYSLSFVYLLAMMAIMVLEYVLGYTVNLHLLSGLINIVVHTLIIYTGLRFDWENGLTAFNPRVPIVCFLIEIIVLIILHIHNELVPRN